MSQSRKIWQDADVGTMLAWLDLSIAQNTNFWDSIISKLDESRRIHTGISFLFTARQVQHKLIKIPREKAYHSDVRPYPKLMDILAKGTHCLPGLAQNIVTQLQNARQRFAEDSSRKDAIQITSMLHNTVTYPEKVMLPAQRLPDPTNLTDTPFPSFPNDALQSDSMHLSRTECSFGDQRRAIFATYNSPRDLGSTRSAALAVQISVLEDKNQRLTEENQTLQNARHAREAMSLDPGESSFYEFYRQGWDMQRRMRSMQKAMGFFDTQVPDPPEFLSYTVLDERMEEIQGELQQITHCLGTAAAGQDVTVIVGSKLESLIHSGFKSLSDTRTADKILHECLSSADTFTVISTLVLAALRDWVLNTAFPNLQDGLMSSSFMSSYRALFIDCVGPSAALNLETAAYHQFINSTLFKDQIVPYEAAVLAETFLQTCSYIIPTGFTSDALEFLRLRLTAIFAAACHLKASSAITNSRRYQFIIYPPNSSQESFHLSISSNQSNRSLNLKTRGRLNIYSTVFVNILNREENLLLQTNNFFDTDTLYSSEQCLHSKMIVQQTVEDGNLPSSCQISNIGLQNGSQDIHDSSSESSSCPSVTDTEDDEYEASVLSNKGTDLISLDGTSASPVIELQRPNKSSVSGNYCPLCNQYFASPWSLNRHKGRLGHKNRLREIQPASQAKH